jgi:hypothetical protein
MFSLQELCLRLFYHRGCYGNQGWGYQDHAPLPDDVFPQTSRLNDVIYLFDK